MQKQVFSKLISMMLTVAALAIGSGTAFAGWTFTDLNQGSMVYSYANGINNKGQIVGYANFGDSQYQATLWSNGVASNLGTLGGGSSTAYAINDAGLIVGSSYTAIAGQGTHATLWTNGVAQDLFPLSVSSTPGPLYGMNTSSATGINNAGQIVGSALGDGLPGRSILWSGGAVQPLAQPTGGGGARAINDNGQIVGGISSGIDRHPALWSNNSAQPQDLGTVGGRLGTAFDINDGGQIVGVIADNVTLQNFGVIWNNGVGERLSTLGGNSCAYAINSFGVIVGQSGQGTNAPFGRGHAVLWKDGAIIDLNSLVDGNGWTLEFATDINDLGQIVGYARDADNDYHAFLLTPDAAPVPIPAALPLFGSGLVLLGFLRRNLFRA